MKTKRNWGFSISSMKRFFFIWAFPCNPPCGGRRGGLLQAPLRSGLPGAGCPCASLTRWRIAKQAARLCWKHLKRRVYALATLLLMATALASCAMDNNFETLVWSDEFNGSAINTANWTYDTGTGSDKGLKGWGNNELQYYTKRSENARIEDFPGGGRGLVIEALKENYSNSAYTSARLLTQGLQSWTYGRIEARIKLPIGQGIWPAFWMLGNNIDAVNWPACGEIDIMEYKGQEPGKVHGTIHYGAPHVYAGKEYTLPDGKKFSDDFHVFAIEWRSGEI